MVTLKEARILLKKYADAWVNRDPDAIIKIFEPVSFLLAECRLF